MPIVICFLLIIVYVYETVQGDTLLDVGDICFKRDGQHGVCTDFDKCPSAIQEVKKNGRPEICSFSGIHPIVCCRKNNTPNNDISSTNSPMNENSLRLKKCRDYHGDIFPINGFIGGLDARPKEYPHMALLGYGEPNSIQWHCGGSLISVQFVLTAAHCLYSRMGKVKFVRLGELDLNSTDDDANTQDFTVLNSYPHPEYKVSSHYHDIAVIQLDRPAKVNDYVKPACLATLRNLNYTFPTAKGWGLTEYGGKSANILQTGMLEYVSHENCSKIYGKSKALSEGIVDDLMICADGGHFKRDTCQGDSGGPLEIVNHHPDINSFPEIIGITSFGKGCGLTAGVYTRVYPYVSWIEKIIWPTG